MNLLSCLPLTRTYLPPEFRCRLLRNTLQPIESKLFSSSLINSLDAFDAFRSIDHLPDHALSLLLSLCVRVRVGIHRDDWQRREHELKEQHASEVERLRATFEAAADEKRKESAAKIALFTKQERIRSELKTQQERLANEMCVCVWVVVRPPINVCAWASILISQQQQPHSNRLSDTEHVCDFGPCVLAVS